MERYQVAIYFNVHHANPFLRPNYTVELEVPSGTTETAITMLALNKLETYPTIYATSVIKM